MESKETIESDVLEQVARILKVPVEAIKNFDEEKAVNIISNTFNDQSNGYNYYPTFNINPIEKIMDLFERLLASEKEKTDLMKEILEKLGK
ncbi:MAG TPA: hypothetical protein VFQ86_11865 [Arachidicoccus soli]|nr:hypothetical protein [Arachidicoccus soli]